MRDLRILFMLLVAVLICLSLCDAKGGGRGGGGGGRSSGGSRGGSSWSKSKSSWSKSSSKSSSSSKYKAHNSWKKSRSSNAKTVKYNYYAGGHHSSSFDGFGMGLGIGLFTAYLLDDDHNLGVNHYYRPYDGDREYEMDRPFRCAKTNITTFFKSRQEMVDGVDIQEGEEICPDSDSDHTYVCYGRMTLAAANFTEVNLTDSNSKGYKEGFRLTVQKGCGKRSKFETAAFASQSKFNAGRNCWTSGISRDINSDGISRAIYEAMGLGGADSATDIISKASSAT